MVVPEGQVMQPGIAEVRLLIAPPLIESPTIHTQSKCGLIHKLPAFLPMLVGTIWPTSPMGENRATFFFGNWALHGKALKGITGVHDWMNDTYFVNTLVRDRGEMENIGRNLEKMKIKQYHNWLEPPCACDDAEYGDCSYIGKCYKWTPGWYSLPWHGNYASVEMTWRWTCRRAWTSCQSIPCWVHFSGSPS